MAEFGKTKLLGVQFRSVEPSERQQQRHTIQYNKKHINKTIDNNNRHNNKPLKPIDVNSLLNSGTIQINTLDEHINSNNVETINSNILIQNNNNNLQSVSSVTKHNNNHNVAQLLHNKSWQFDTKQRNNSQQQNTKKGSNTYTYNNHNSNNKIKYNRQIMNGNTDYNALLTSRQQALRQHVETLEIAAKFREFVLHSDNNK